MCCSKKKKGLPFDLGQVMSILSICLPNSVFDLWAVTSVPAEKKNNLHKIKHTNKHTLIIISLNHRKPEKNDFCFTLKLYLDKVR